MTDARRTQFTLWGQPVRPPRSPRRYVREITAGYAAYPLIILFGLNAVDELDRTVFGVLGPEIRDHFGLDNEGVLAVVSLVAVAALGGQVLIGYYADRFSRVRIAASIATDTARPVPAANRAHSATPVVAIRTRLQRSA